MAVIADVHKFMCIYVQCASWLWMLTQKRGLKEGWSLVRGSSVHGLKQVMDTCSTMQTEQSQCISLGLFSCTSLKNHVQARRYLWHQKNQVQALRYLWHKKSCAGMEVFMAALKNISCAGMEVFMAALKNISCAGMEVFMATLKNISCAGMEVFMATLKSHVQAWRYFWQHRKITCRHGGIYGSITWVLCTCQSVLKVIFHNFVGLLVCVWISGQRVNFRSVCEFQVSVWISDQCVNFSLVCEFQVGVIGLVEEEWIATLSTVDVEDITFVDFVDVGQCLANLLRQQVRVKVFVTWLKITLLKASSSDDDIISCHTSFICLKASCV